MVALFENGVTVAIAGCGVGRRLELLQPAGRHLGVAVEEHDVAVRRRAMPRLTLPTKPRRSGLREDQPRSPAAGHAAERRLDVRLLRPVDHQHRRWWPRSVWRSRLARQAASSAAAP